MPVKLRLKDSVTRHDLPFFFINKLTLIMSLSFLLLTTSIGCQNTSAQTPPLANPNILSNIPSNTSSGTSPSTLSNNQSNTLTNSFSNTTLPTNNVVDTAQKSLIKDDLRHEYKLENGLNVIIKEDHRAPVVMTQVWYHVGSTDEPKGMGGISHLLEHMMFKGTDKVSGMDFDRLIAKFGGDQNAFTSHDYTGYYEMLPANRLALALELEADRMMNLKFDSPDFIREFIQEREVVMEERRQRTDDNPISRAFEVFRMMALPDSPKGRSIIGPMTDIENIDIEDLKNWYDTWYAPNNATLVIVGDVDPNDAIDSIEHYFADLPKRDIPTRPSVSQAGWQGFQQRTMLETANVATLLMAFNVPTIPSTFKANTAQEAQSEQDVYDLLLLQFILDGGYAARFESQLVRDMGLLASIVSYYDPYERGDGLFLIQATPSDGVSLQEAQDAILQEINSLKYEKISQDEIERARGNLVKGFVFSQDSMSGQAYMIGSMQTRGLDERMIGQLPKKLSQVNQTHLKSIANKYFVKDNLSILHVEPYQE